MKCTVSEDCATYSCSMEGGIATLSLKIDASNKPFSAEVSLKVPGKDFDWSHTFKNGEEIQVPGFPQKIMGHEVADLQLMFKMYEDKMGHGMKFKVTGSRFQRFWRVVFFSNYQVIRTITMQAADTFRPKIEMF